MRRVLLVFATVLLLGSSPAFAQDDGPVEPPAGEVAETRGGYAYPIAWLLPLVFVVGIGTVGRALTRDLRRRD